MLKTLSLLLCLVVIASGLGGCAGSDTGSMTPTPITDFKAVAGNWQGPVTGISQRSDDWVEVTITPDGKYDFGVYRTIGVFGGTGTYTLSNGKLEMRGERGTATYTLYEGGGKRMLQVQGVLSDGRQLTAKLSPKP
jgi:hypothetical protein